MRNLAVGRADRSHVDQRWKPPTLACHQIGFEDAMPCGVGLIHAERNRIARFRRYDGVRRRTDKLLAFIAEHLCERAVHVHEADAIRFHDGQPEMRLLGRCAPDAQLRIRQSLRRDVLYENDEAANAFIRCIPRTSHPAYELDAAIAAHAFVFSAYDDLTAQDATLFVFPVYS